MKKILSVALALALTLSMFTSFAFAATKTTNQVNYTEIDYSKPMNLNVPISGTLNDDDEYVKFYYNTNSSWSGNAFGASVYLEGGKTYDISFDVETADGSTAQLQPNLFVLRNYLINDSYQSDMLVGGLGEVSIQKSGTVSKSFTPTSNGTYKLLFICNMDSEAINYTVKVSGDDLDIPSESSNTNKVSYTELDYSKKVTADGAPLTGTLLSNGYYVNTEYWKGNAISANAYFQAGKKYEISFETSYPGDISNKIQPNIIVLTDGSFNGADDMFNGDDLTPNAGTLGEGNSATSTITFEPTVSSNYRLLGICYFFNTTVNYEITVKTIYDADTEPDTDVITETVYTNQVSYTELDYSDKVTVGTASEGNLKFDDQSVITQYWNGNAVAKSVDLEANHLYEISFTTSNPDESTNEMQDNIFVLTGGEFAGSDNGFNGDALTNDVGSYSKAKTYTVTTKFIPTETATYRLLGICYMYNSSVDYSITVTDLGEINAKDISALDYEWKTEENLNDYSNVAMGPNGELAVADYDDEYDSKTDTYNYYLRVYNNDGTLKFKVPMAYESDCTPVFDEEGNVYIGTYTDDIQISEDTDSDSYADVAFVHAFSSDGEELWTKQLVEDTDDDYDIWTRLYIEDGILIVRADYNILGLDTKTGDIIWEIKNINCLPENPNGGLTVADGKIYLALYEDNTVTFDGNEVDLNNAIIVIDAKTGEITDYYDKLDDCCGATDSNLLVKDGYLYFVCDGKTQVGDETISCPFYAVNVETGEMNIYDLGFDDDDNYLIYNKGDELLVSDNCGNIQWIGLLDGKIGINSPVKITEVLFPDDADYNAVKIGEKYFMKEAFDYADIYDMFVDNNHNFYMMMYVRDINDKGVSAVFKFAIVEDESGDTVEISALPVNYGYGHDFVSDENYLYFTGGEDDGIYAVKLPDETADDFIKGDINLDGVVDIIDVAMARAHIVGNKLLDDAAQHRGDMNGDDMLDIIDVAMMRKLIVDKK